MAIFVFQAMCYFIPYIELAVTHTSVLTILAITVERYYAICLPLQVGTVFPLCLDSVAIFEGRFSFTVLPAYCDTRYTGFRIKGHRFCPAKIDHIPEMTIKAKCQMTL